MFVRPSQGQACWVCARRLQSVFSFRPLAMWKLLEIDSHAHQYGARCRVSPPNAAVQIRGLESGRGFGVIVVEGTKRPAQRRRIDAGGRVIEQVHHLQKRSGVNSLAESYRALQN